MVILPNRRECLVYSFELRETRYFGTIGFHPETQQPAEVFLQGGKSGSNLEAAIRDSAIAASKAIEYGAGFNELRAAMTRYDNGAPAGPLGVLFDLYATKRVVA